MPTAFGFGIYDAFSDDEPLTSPVQIVEPSTPPIQCHRPDHVYAPQHAKAGASILQFQPEFDHRRRIELTLVNQIELILFIFPGYQAQ